MQWSHTGELGGEGSRPPPSLDDLDPAQAGTVEEFANYVRRLILRAGLSQEDVVSWSVKHDSRPLSSGVLSESLGAKRPFSRNALWAVTKACGLAEND